MIFNTQKHYGIRCNHTQNVVCKFTQGKKSQSALSNSILHKNALKRLSVLFICDGSSPILSFTIFFSLPILRSFDLLLLWIVFQNCGGFRLYEIHGAVLLRVVKKCFSGVVLSIKCDLISTASGSMQTLTASTL